MKARIVRITNPDKTICYQIQQRHFLFRWRWAPARVNIDVSVTDTFQTLEEAAANLCYFDGTKPKVEVVK